MKKTILFFIAVLLIIGVNVFADDVSIDSFGNITTGLSSNGNLEVIGASGEYGIVGMASDTGGAGVYGENRTGINVNYGILGYESYGVYGYSLNAWAGYFSGHTRVTGNLTVDGTIINTGIGDITGVTAGIGLTGGGSLGDINIDIDFAGSGTSDIAARSDHNHDTAYSPLSHDHNAEYYDKSYIDSLEARIVALENSSAPATIVFTPTSLTITDATAGTVWDNASFTITVTDTNGVPLSNVILEISFPFAKSAVLTSGYFVELLDDGVVTESPMQATTETNGTYVLNFRYQRGGGVAYVSDISVTSGTQSATATFTVAAS